MPKFKLIATGAGGLNVADIIVEKVGREQALSEGIPELLLLPNFPPEAIQFYREALDRGFSRDEACDVLLEKWNLQFWCDPQKDDTPIPTPAAAPLATAVAPAQPPTTSTNVEIYRARMGRASPRALLRDELKQLNADVHEMKGDIDRLMKEYTVAKTRRDECRRLLKSLTPAKVIRGKRNLHAIQP